MQSFAKTFVCENWSNFLRQELEGTMFEGEIDGDTFIIRDEVKIKRKQKLQRLFCPRANHGYVKG